MLIAVECGGCNIAEKRNDKQNKQYTNLVEQACLIAYILPVIK